MSVQSCSSPVWLPPSGFSEPTVNSARIGELCEPESSPGGSRTTRLPSSDDRADPHVIAGFFDGADRWGGGARRSARCGAYWFSLRVLPNVRCRAELRRRFPDAVVFVARRDEFANSLTWTRSTSRSGEFRTSSRSLLTLGSNALGGLLPRAYGGSRAALAAFNARARGTEDEGPQT